MEVEWSGAGSGDDVEVEAECGAGDSNCVASGGAGGAGGSHTQSTGRKFDLSLIGPKLPRQLSLTFLHLTLDFLDLTLDFLPPSTFLHSRLSSTVVVPPSPSTSLYSRLSSPQLSSFVVHGNNRRPRAVCPGTI